MAYSTTMRAQPFKAHGAAHTQRPTSVRRWHVRCSAQQAASAPSSRNQLLMSAVEALFKFPPFFNMAAKNARQMIVKRGEKLGMDWSGTMAELQTQDWAAAIERVRDPAVQYPTYYTQPFHAYPEGNLCWDAALEMTLAAKSVHAAVMDPAGKELDPQGDHKLRSTYGERMLQLMSQLGCAAPGQVGKVLDMGCATGLSSLALRELFPAAHITGVDLSPHFLAVADYEQQKREAAAGQQERISFYHGAAEATGLPGSSFDVVSICLVCHELPEAASKAIFREAARVLRPGGCLAIMEMDPGSAVFQRIFSNPFAFTAFKSTEPWLQEYIALDMPAALQEAGFGQPLQASNTPRHKTVVAVKQ